MQYESEVIGIPPGYNESYTAIASDSADIGWDLVDGTLQKPSNGESLSDIRARKWEEIKAKRQSIQNSGVLVNTYWYPSTRAARINVLCLSALGDDLPETILETIDGQESSANSELLAELISSFAALDNDSSSCARSHKCALDVSLDPENYDFSTGWPATYVIL